MPFQNKKAIQTTLITLGIVVYIFATGCRNEAVNHYNRGTVNLRKGKYNSAISNYTKAIEKEPMDASAYNSRAFAHVAKGEYDQAILDYTKAIKINSKFAEAYCNRGNAHALKGEGVAAVSDYSKAIEISPTFALAYSNRGIAYYKSGEYEKSWENVHKAQSLGYQVPAEFLTLLREASGRGSKD